MCLAIARKFHMRRSLARGVYNSRPNGSYFRRLRRLIASPVIIVGRRWVPLNLKKISAAPNCAYNAESANYVWHGTIIQAIASINAHKLIIRPYNSRDNDCAFTARCALHSLLTLPECAHYSCDRLFRITAIIPEITLPLL